MADLAKLEAAIRESPAAKTNRLRRSMWGSAKSFCCGLTAACGENPRCELVAEMFGMSIEEKYEFAGGWDGNSSVDTPARHLGRRLARELIDGLSPVEAAR